MPLASTYAKLLAAMFFWGGTWVAGRVIAQEVEAPLAVAALRFFITGLVLALAVQASGKALARPRQASDWGVVILMGVFGIFLYGLCFFYGLQFLPAGQAALIVALNPVLVVLIAWALGQERMTARRAVGATIALAGSVLVIGRGDPLAFFNGALGLGEVLIVGCVLSWTIYTFIGRQATRRLPALETTLYASLIGALLFSATAWGVGGIDLAAWSPRVWASLVFLAVFGTALAYTWFTAAVHQLGAGHASVFINLVPVFAVLQAAILLGEHLAPAVLGGGLLVIAGVGLTSYQRAARGERTR